MATDFNTEANYFDLKGVMLVANDAEHAEEGREAGDDHGIVQTTDAEGHQIEMVAGHEVHDGGSAGMPQLDVSTYSNQIFWLVLSLVAVYFLFARIAIPRIRGTLEQRGQTIQRDLDRAAEMKMKAEEAEEAYKQALIDARAKAHEISEKTKADIQADLDAASAEADAEIAKQATASSKRIAKLQKDAEASVKDIATDVAKSLVDAIAPGAGDDKALASAVAKVLKG